MSHHFPGLLANCNTWSWSCFCSGVTLAPSDELWPTLEVQIGLLVPWAHHEIVQRDDEKSELSVWGLKRAQGLWAWPLVITRGSVETLTTLGSPKERLLHVCSPILSHSQSCCGCCHHFRLRHLSLTLLQIPES